MSPPRTLEELRGRRMVAPDHSLPRVCSASFPTLSTLSTPAAALSTTTTTVSVTHTVVPVISAVASGASVCIPSAAVCMYHFPPLSCRNTRIPSMWCANCSHGSLFPDYYC